MLQGAALGRVRAKPDPRRKLSLYGEFVADVSPRHVPIQLLVRAAAATDPEAVVWDQLPAERMEGMTLFARALHREGHLRPDVSAEEAGDMLWTCNSPEVYELLVLQRGWTPERYGRWVADTLIAGLIAGLLP